MMDSNLPRLIGKRVCRLVSCPIHRYGCMTVKWSTQIIRPVWWLVYHLRRHVSMMIIGKLNQIGLLSSVGWYDCWLFKLSLIIDYP